MTVGVILILSAMLLIALWQTNLTGEDYFLPLIVTGASMMLAAMVYSALNGRNSFADKGIHGRSEQTIVADQFYNKESRPPVSWRRVSHINKFEFINDNLAGTRKANWTEKRLLAVNEPLQRARSRACPHCGGNAGNVCPCKYRSKY